MRNTCRPNVNLFSFSSFFFPVLKQINERNEKRPHLSTFERMARDSTSHGGEPVFLEFRRNETLFRHLRALSR